jgi:hypothetical protein
MNAGLGLLSFSHSMILTVEGVSLDQIVWAWQEPATTKVLVQPLYTSLLGETFV